MKGNVSGYVCNHGSPSGERDTASPRLWAMLRTQASDEEADDVCSRRHLYCDTPVVTSWAVAGQQVVFLHMYLQTRVTLEAFPVVTPRGRSVSFPTRGTMVTYVTWDVFLRCNQNLVLARLAYSHNLCYTPMPYVFCGNTTLSFTNALLHIRRPLLTAQNCDEYFLW